MWRRLVCCLILVSADPATAGQPLLRPYAQPDPAAMCEMAGQAAAREFGVPPAVLLALMLTESGRKTGHALRPWPWTVNMEGDGQWFDTEADARAFVETRYRRGARSFDIGCFQINYKWHHQGFSSIDEMFRPLANARYAARFLSALFAELGSWDRAAGAYHSRTPELAGRYRARFLQHLARMEGDVGDTAPQSPKAQLAEGAAPRSRRDTGGGYPLLHSGAGGVMGSLVPTGLFRARPLIGAGAGG